VTATSSTPTTVVPAAADRRRNNFDVLRLVFAGCVVFSHSFALLGQGEPVVWGRTLGNLGVLGFFTLSGYLIAQSFQRRTSVPQYLGNRFLRIFPGLVVALVVANVLGGLLGHFAKNPVPYIVDGPVWTLTWEVICYLVLAALGVLGVLNGRGFPAFYAAAWMLFLANIGNTSDFFLAIAPMFLMFGAGALFAVHLDQLHWGWVVAAGVGLLATLKYGAIVDATRIADPWVPFLYGPTVTPEMVQRVMFMVSFPIVVIWLGKATRPGWRLRDDLSYGSYIYGWPVAQTVVFYSMRWHVRLNAPELFLITAVITAPIAFLSWRFVERPSLRLKRFLRRRTPRATVTEPVAGNAATLAEPDPNASA
jgi:peptidoglycan/LPS O-acetylase OafA/YrhL